MRLLVIPRPLLTYRRGVIGESGTVARVAAEIRVQAEGGRHAVFAAVFPGEEIGTRPEFADMPEFGLLGPGRH